MFVLLVVPARRAFAVDIAYTVPTSSPEGRAVCSVKGKVKRPDLGAALAVTLSPTAGEGALQIRFLHGGSSFAAAGVQPGCDIFPDSPSSFMLPVPVTPDTVGRSQTFKGVFDMHAHPGSDCGSAGVATGAITAVVTGSPTATISGPTFKCDNDQTHGNLSLDAFIPATATRGEPVSGQVFIANHGPGLATNATFTGKVGKGLFVRGADPTQGTCRSDFRKHRVSCDLGPVNDVAMIDLDMIPLKEGKATVSETIGADNDGGLLDHKAKIATDVAKGSSAILTVEVRCKGAAGTVTINPNGSGGVTTCTCPDPADATKDAVVCIEVYAQQTTVTLTPNATTGQFDKWKGACAGNPAACMVTLDPAAQHPDVSTTAKFK